MDHDIGPDFLEDLEGVSLGSDVRGVVLCTWKDIACRVEVKDVDFSVR